MQAALTGIRVLDLSSVVFGPLASQVLADYGAEVIKIEPPAGDSTRHTGPAVEPGMAAMFMGTNRSKKSVVLDLKQDEARQALHALLANGFIPAAERGEIVGVQLHDDRVAALGFALGVPRDVGALHVPGLRPVEVHVDGAAQAPPAQRVGDGLDAQQAGGGLFHALFCGSRRIEGKLNR